MKVCLGSGIKKIVRNSLQYQNIEGTIEKYENITSKSQRQTLLREAKVFVRGWSVVSDTNSGVRQGFVLGPFLFLLYVNDISENLQNHVRLFADDTSLHVIVDDDIISSANSLTNDLETVHQW